MDETGAFKRKQEDILENEAKRFKLENIMEDETAKLAQELELSILDGDVSTALSNVAKLLALDSNERAKLNVKLIENKNGQRPTLIELHVTVYDKDSVESDFEEIMKFNISMPAFFTVEMLKRWIFMKEGFGVQNQILIIGDRIAGNNNSPAIDLITEKDRKSGCPVEIVLYLTEANEADGGGRNDDATSEDDYVYYEEVDTNEYSGDQEKDSSSWACPYCTFENKPSVKTCEVCLNTRAS